ncbi:MAG: acetyl-CoA hydrolase/transferase family protein [Promethearchaeota archaeon]|nr:MAG: acetyl-CoA hydrolase/transferase family protein [Candidatus Lokiarchaeota archaeon]
MEAPPDPPNLSNSNWDKSPQSIQVQDLVDIIKPGYRIFLGTGCSESLIFSQELIRKKYRWFDCTLVHLLTLSDFEYFSEDTPTHFRHNTLSIIGSDQIRKAVNSGKSDFIPIKSSEIPRMLRTRMIPIDVAILQVTPPDKYGYCSLGINVDINKTVAKTAKILILQVNPNMPYTCGNSHIKFSEADYFLEKKTPLLEYTIPEISTESDQIIQTKIGNFLTRLIEDGSTLNVGIGKLPPLMWQFLAEKKNLAIYSEALVLSDTLLEMIQKGIINCKNNTYPNILASFALGKKHHYEFLDRNPMFEFQPTEFLNNIINIAKNYKLCSIYSAMAVDLTGQITNDLPNKFYSGIGGEHDFIQGTALSKHGKTIIILPSTAKNESISRIAPTVSRSSIPASDVHYIITEWGIARLGGKNIRERALQLINIAHPKFRKTLLEEAKSMHLLYQDQILPRSIEGHLVIYPEQYEWKFTTKNGTQIQFRPVKPTDEPLLQRFFYQLNEKDRIFRFLTPKKIFPHEQTQLEVNIDYITNMAIIGLIGNENQEEVPEIICAGNYYSGLNDTTNRAEIATVITNKWQKQGLGTHIFEKLIEIGIANGFLGFYGEFAPTNSGILTILKNLPHNVRLKTDAESITFLIEFTESERFPPSDFS